MKSVLEFDNITKIYDLHTNVSYKEVLFNFLKRKRVSSHKKFTALENVSFSVHEGETIGIIGKNGSGKSTTLGLIAGVLKPSRGTVNVYKRISPLLELGGGFHPDLNAYENIRLNGVLLGIPLKTIKQNSDAIIEFAELIEFADQPIRTYSSGMMARLGFSIVTQLNPEMLLIDEVLAVGDERFRNKCLDLMQDFKQKQITMILVSHNANDIRMVCDRVIWIDKHKIRMDGDVATVLAEYEKFMKEDDAKE